MGSWEVLETMVVADCALSIEGTTLADLFETAARALAELMVDPATIEPSVDRTLTLEAASLDLLLYDWLAELIFLKDSEQLVITRAEVEVTAAGHYALRARCVGGRIDRARTALRADPKAVTLHQFMLEQGRSGWHARVVIDI